MKRLFLVATLGALSLGTISLMPTPLTPAAHADSPQERARERAAERIERAWERDSVLRRYDLDADAEGGRRGYIELDGEVRTLAERNRAVRIARSAAPGYRLVNEIEIDRNADRDDD